MLQTRFGYTGSDTSYSRRWSAKLWIMTMELLPALGQSTLSGAGDGSGGVGMGLGATWVGLGLGLGLACTGLGDCDRAASEPGEAPIPHALRHRMRATPASLPTLKG